jgi:antitoxin component YwqK of YwqJK toxin-antitoxin module
VKYPLSILFSLSLVFTLISVEAQINPNGHNVFYHEGDSVISSEGYMRDGRPDGYWKTFNEQGIMISEGNRKDYELDSTWKFYDDTGKLKMEINYLAGKKNGFRKTYRDDEILEEYIVDDVKQGETNWYYPDGTLKKKVIFIDGLEEGMAMEYAEDGRTITLIKYKSGFIVERQKINRYDNNNRKHGLWKYFHDNGVVRLEGMYKRGLENGYFKEYDYTGNLITTTKYVDGVKKEDARELAKLDVRKDYYADGQVKIVATYNKEGVPEGIRREYAPDGTIESSYIFRNGTLIGEGVVTEKGERDGIWKEYYDDGKLRAEGKYNKDVKTGSWKYYHFNGQLEQEGDYNGEGLPEGEWRWYYASGDLLREEFYYLGRLDGAMIEYDKDGMVLTQGEYIEGLEDGKWIYIVGEARIEGSYVDGMRNGPWKYTHVPRVFGMPEVLRFEGRFVEDNPHGRHTYYWDNGKRKDAGEYIMGRKEGDWVSYNYDGTPFLVITYKNGIELKYDGVKVDLTGTEEDLLPE